MLLIGSIAASSLIFVLFKLFVKFQIDTFQAIVFNYFTAFSLGIWLFNENYSPQIWENQIWFYPTLITGFLFIGLFVVMGLSTQFNGVGKTSIAVKMSMAFSIVLFLFLFNESLSWFKMVGILGAILSVFLVSSSDSTTSSQNKKHVWMLFFLFFGSGLLDLMLNYSQQNWLGSLHSALYSAFGFGFAAIIGSIVLLIQILRNKTIFHWKNILAGILLGIPNFFSIYLLLASYQSKVLSDASILAVTNVGVVLLSSLIGLFFFHEKNTIKQWIGLVFALLSILFIYLSTRL